MTGTPALVDEADVARFFARVPVAPQAAVRARQVDLNQQAQRVVLDEARAGRGQLGQLDQSRKALVHARAVIDGGELVERRFRRIAVEQRHGALDVALASRELAEIDTFKEGREMVRRVLQA